MEDTIAAISTMVGESSINVIRVIGKESIKIVNKIFSRNIINVQSHTVHYGFILENNEKIDEVFVSIFKSPKSFTTEDVVEISTHGGISSVNKVIELLITNGCRLAEPGEFLKRAFLNGRIDLTQAEAVSDLINSQTESSRKMAIKGIDKEIYKVINDLKEKILSLIANIEVNIDYPEYEDAVVVTKDMIKENNKYIENKINELLVNSKKGLLIKNGLKIENIEVETNNQSTLDSNIESTLCPTEEDTYKSHIATIVEGQSCSKTTPECELTIAGENFYVISSDSTNTTLLAKYDLDTTLNSQTSTNPTLITFSNGNYWDDGNKNLLSPYNDNGANYKGNPYPYVYDSNSNLYTYVNAYANKMAIATGISISGKIMSYEQAMSLSTDMRKDLNNHYYWLGSAVLLGGYCSQQIDYKYDESDTPKVQFLYGPGGAPQPEEPSPYPTPGNTSNCGYVTIWTISYDGSINQVDSGFGNGNSYIRPVIIVPTSAL